MNLNELTIAEAAEGYRKKQFLPSDVVSACLEKIRKEDGDINAFLEVSETAWEEAKQLDETYVKAGVLPPLFGIPVAVKDNIMVKGRKITAGSNILKNYHAPYDATVIRKLKQQGVIIIGKTNLDEFAMGSSTENSASGTTKNPYDHARVPGGSSGGSAAAISTHFSLAALGSDTGGSIRQPASFCGIVGFKPSYGTTSRHGLIAMASSLDQIGPMTKTVEDAEFLFRAIAGTDYFDATLSPPPSAQPEKEFKEIILGVPKEYFSEGLAPDVEHLIRASVDIIANAGVTVKEISLPHSSYALSCYYIIVPSEVSTNLARFDGIRFGHFTKDVNNLQEVYTKSRQEGFGDEVKRRIMLGTFVLSAGYYDAYYVKAQKVRNLIRQDFTHAFEEVDYIVGPTTPTPAFGFGAHKNNPLSMYLADMYTVAINLAGLPALSLNAGFVKHDAIKLPVGLQIIAPYMKDFELLRFSKQVEKMLG
ncbi:MAG: Asp-tRNA(Asn)/Glu-tRNA(Gln) amidotransferase subunit GatA [Candidatus Colwellbacteria bacterium]|nr:Asp-tRNA(Asn)/Glu-tRNA(Gln) amidotransferase subunit GatA [Candidatus Colwellbacteria bacterium]